MFAPQGLHHVRQRRRDHAEQLIDRLGAAREVDDQRAPGDTGDASGQDAQRGVAQRLGAQLGSDIDVSLIHDGTAAATAYAGAKHTAVVMMGTALGIGFPPPANNLRTTDTDLTILTNGD